MATGGDRQELPPDDPSEPSMREELKALDRTRRTLLEGELPPTYKQRLIDEIQKAQEEILERRSKKWAPRSYLPLSLEDKMMLEDYRLKMDNGTLTNEEEMKYHSLVLRELAPRYKKDREAVVKELNAEYQQKIDELQDQLEVSRIQMEYLRAGTGRAEVSGVSRPRPGVAFHSTPHPIPYTQQQQNTPMDGRAHLHEPRTDGLLEVEEENCLEEIKYVPYPYDHLTADELTAMKNHSSKDMEHQYRNSVGNSVCDGSNNTRSIDDLLSRLADIVKVFKLSPPTLRNLMQRSLVGDIMGEVKMMENVNADLRSVWFGLQLKYGNIVTIAEARRHLQSMTINPEGRSLTEIFAKVHYYANIINADRSGAEQQILICNQVIEAIECIVANHAPQASQQITDQLAKMKKKMVSQGKEVGSMDTLLFYQQLLIKRLGRDGTLGRRRDYHAPPPTASAHPQNSGNRIHAVDEDRQRARKEDFDRARRELGDVCLRCGQSEHQSKACPHYKNLNLTKKCQNCGCYHNEECMGLLDRVSVIRPMGSRGIWDHPVFQCLSTLPARETVERLDDLASQRSPGDKIDKLFQRICLCLWSAFLLLVSVFILLPVKCCKLTYHEVTSPFYDHMHDSISMENKVRQCLVADLPLRGVKPRINVSFGFGLTESVLLDTGSSYSLIGLGLLQKIEQKAGHQITREPLQTCLAGVTGDRLNTYGKVNLTMTDKLGTIRFPFIVVQNGVEVLLGMNYLEHRGNGTLQLNNLSLDSNNDVSIPLSAKADKANDNKEDKVNVTSTSLQTDVKRSEEVGTQAGNNQTGQLANSPQVELYVDMELSSKGYHMVPCYAPLVKRDTLLFQVNDEMTDYVTDGLVTIEENKFCLPFYKRDGTPQFMKKGTSLGSLVKIPDHAEPRRFPLELVNTDWDEILNLRRAKQCFCKYDRKEHKYCFMMRGKQSVSDFQNIEVANHLQSGPLDEKGGYLFIQKSASWLETTEKALEKYGQNSKEHATLFIRDESELDAEVLSKITILSRIFQSVEIRTVPTSVVCDLHREPDVSFGAGNYDDGLILNLHLINSKIRIPKSSQKISQFTIDEGRMTMYEQDKPSKTNKMIWDAYLHSPYLKTGDKEAEDRIVNKFVRLLKQMISPFELHSLNIYRSGPIDRKIRMVQGKGQKLGPISLVGINPLFKEETSHHSSKSGMMMLPQLANCSCYHCHQYDRDEQTDARKIGIIRAEVTEEHETIELLDMDYMEEHMTGEEWENNSEYSIASNLDDKIDGKITVHENKTDHSGKCHPSPADEYDYSSVPQSERGYLRTLLDAFQHIFCMGPDQISLFRDLRVKLELRKKVDAQVKPPKMYNSDPRTCKVIVEILREMEEIGLGRFVGPQPFFNPLFLRVKNKAEAEKLLLGTKPKEVKYRLISDFRALNAMCTPLHSYITPIKECLMAVQPRNCAGGVDLKSAYKSMPIAEGCLEMTTIAIQNTYFQFITTLEGLSSAVSMFHHTVSKAMVFTNPLPHQSNSGPQTLKTSDHLIKTAGDVKKFLAEHPNRFDSPRTLESPKLTIEQTPESLTSTTSHKLRVKLEERQPTGALIEHQHVAPELLPTRKCTVSFLDDVAVFAESPKEYRKALLGLFIDLHNLGVRLDLKKCDFYGIFDGKGQIEFLGHEITADGFCRPSANRSTKLKELQYPKSLKELQAVMGLFNFHSNRIHRYGDMANELYNAMQRARKEKTGKFALNDDEKRRFDEIKDRLVRNEYLYLPRSQNEVLFLEVDASAIAASAILFATDGQGQKKVVTYYSKIFPKYVRDKICNTASEALALALSLESCRFYIFSHPTFVVSDCRSLIALMVYGKQCSNIRLARLLSSITAYPIKGYIHTDTDHNRADVLNRQLKLPKLLDAHDKTPKAPFKEISKDEVPHKLQEGVCYELATLERASRDEGRTLLMPDTADTIHLLRQENSHQNQSDGLHVQHVSNRLGVTRDTYESFLLLDVEKTEQLPSNATHVTDEPQNYVLSIRDVTPTRGTPDILNYVSVEFIAKRQATELPDLMKKALKGDEKLNFLENGLLVRKVDDKHKIILSKSMALNIIAVVHLQTHFAYKIMHKFMKTYFHSTGMENMCQSIQRACQACAISKPSKSHDTRGNIFVRRASRPMELLYADHIVFSKPIRQGGRVYTGIFMLQDSYSNYLFADLVTRLDSSETQRILGRINRQFVLSGSTLITDNATVFHSSSFTKFCEDLNITQKHTTPYRSQANYVETTNAVIRELFFVFLRNTPQMLPDSVMEKTVISYNTRPHSWQLQSNEWVSPYVIMFGRQPWNLDLGIELHHDEKALQNLFQQHQESHKNSAKTSAFRETVEPNDLVLIRDKNRRFKDQPPYLPTLYQVKKRQGSQLLVVPLLHDPQKKLVHASDVKKFYLTSETLKDCLDPFLYAKFKHIILGEFPSSRMSQNSLETNPPTDQNSQKTLKTVSIWSDFSDCSTPSLNSGVSADSNLTHDADVPSISQAPSETPPSTPSTLKDSSTSSDASTVIDINAYLKYKAPVRMFSRRNDDQSPAHNHSTPLADITTSSPNVPSPAHRKSRSYNALKRFRQSLETVLISPVKKRLSTQTKLVDHSIKDPSVPIQHTGNFPQQESTPTQGRKILRPRRKLDYKLYHETGEKREK